jgi:tetratricopeptide (TPR) repeat protein
MTDARIESSEHVGPLVEELAATLDDESLGTRLVAIARAHKQQPEVLDAIGAALLARKRRDDAQVVFDLAVSAGSENAETYYQFGRALLLTGDHRGAEVSFAIAVRFDPTHTDARVYLALCRLEDDPRAAFELVAESRSPFAPEIRAMIAEKLDRPDFAERALARVFPALDGEVEGRCMYTIWHCADRRYARALVHARALFVLRQAIPDHELHKPRARCAASTRAARFRTSRSQP